MENIADALRMSAAVLVFVIAMAIALSLLGQANATAREIFYGMDTTTYLNPERVARTSRPQNSWFRNNNTNNIQI